MNNHNNNNNNNNNNNCFILNVFLLLILIFELATKTNAIEKYLFDSTQYQGELNWDKEAFGDSVELPGWKEQSFSQKSGDVWRVHFVCDIASSNPNNWLRLPFIDREEANRLSIKLEYTIRECKKYPGEIRSCKETFQLLYIESSAEDQIPNFSESNYKYLKTIAPNSESKSSAFYTSTQTSTQQQQQQQQQQPNIFRTEVDLALRGDKTKGVYLVFRDQGACVSLLSIKVYYTLCPAQVNNLAIFPRTPTGSNLTDLVQKNGKCVPNSESKNIPYAYCQTNGNWFFIQTQNSQDQSSVCLCRPGYYYSAQIEQCLACPQGKFKSELSNSPECIQCPDYSYSKSSASKYCTCIDGYFRANTNDLTSPCLPYPPEPKNLTVYYIDQSSIKLRWNIIENYEKSLVQYKLECFKCLENTNVKNELLISSDLIKRSDNYNCQERVKCENYINMNPKKDELFDNKVQLSQLDSNQLYLIELYAQHLNGLFKTKTVDLLVKTSESLPNENLILNLSAYQFIDINQIYLNWILNESALINRTILNYEIRYWLKDYFDKANILSIKGENRNFTFKNSNPTVISTNLYIFQIRAKFDLLGWTGYTEPIESIKISAQIFYNKFMNKSIHKSVVEQDTLTTSISYDQLKSTLNENQNLASKSETFTIYVLIALLTSLCFIVLILTFLVVLSRSGRVKFLSNYLTKQVPEGLSSDCDLNHNHHQHHHNHHNRLHTLTYNQFSTGAGTATTTSSTSGGSSPLWPKTYIDPHTYEDPTKVVSLFARELSPSNIIIESVIGGGEFGDVCKGILKQNPWSDQVVAIKTLKGAATEQNRCDFLTEASIMAQFNDPNVIRLEGVVTQSNPLMIVTEYMENGSLDTFLRLNESKLKLSNLIKILKDVALGMRYLSEMNYIHRDLAARNILVNKDLVCKVADFGLSREIDLDSYEYTTKGGKIPIRWTAPEACNFRKYTYASDVWSFGVLAWEVMSFGERPYWSWENKDVVRAIQELYRLPPPNTCPDCVYKLMLRCWQEDRLLRPKFREICLILDDILKTNNIDELNLKQPAKIKELLPINPRAPTKIQMTKTRLFLSKLNLEQYADMFDKVGLGNLSNLFQLEVKDLMFSLNIQNQYDQKKILDELKRISDSYNQHLLLNQLNLNHQQQHQQQQQQQQNSYTLFNTLKLNANKIQLNSTSNSTSEQLSMKQAHQQQQSIFNLIRNQHQSVNNSDLLSFSNLPQTNGFLV